jgi:hypothetical protein
MTTKDNRSGRKLSVRKDTLRRLTPIDEQELAAAAGGARGAPRTFYCTRGGELNDEA